MKYILIKVPTDSVLYNKQDSTFACYHCVELTEEELELLIRGCTEISNERIVSDETLEKIGKVL